MRIFKHLALFLAVNLLIAGAMNFVLTDPSIVKIYLEDIRKKLQDGTSESIGLANVNERLRLYYNNTAGLKIESQPGEGTIVSFTVPHNQSPSPLLNYEQHAEQLRKEEEPYGK